jgi:flagellar biosynthesis/type III secretory pathway M-ring protein FliF/YscJ
MKVPWTEMATLLFPAFKYILIMSALALVVLFFLRPLIATLKTRGTYSENEIQGNYSQGLPNGGVTAELQGGAAHPMIGHELRNYTEAEVVKQLASADARKFADLLRHWLK